MRKTDYAYLAGIVDGEGNISLCLARWGDHKKYQSYFITVQVANTNEWLCQWLKLAFGGSLSSLTQKSPKHKPQFQWSIRANPALELLKLILPYLRLKKAQAEIAIAFQSKRRRPRMLPEDKVLAEAQRILMQSLNKRGTAL